MLPNPQSASEAESPDRKNKGVQLMKEYVAPQLNVDEFVPDTMIASAQGGPKNDNAGNNQNCWSFNCVWGRVEDGENACLGDSLSVGC